MMEHHKNINQKLESFMKRNLPSSDYQKIRCYERCVVDKTMKLALLTAKNLIITDSPPRTLHYTLPLIDFLSLNLVQDLPDFLHGSEKLKSQHISLKFRYDTLAKQGGGLKKSNSQSSCVSASSEGETSSETSPSNSMSGTSLSSTLWHTALTPSRAPKHSPVRLNASGHEENFLRVEKLDLSDSGMSLSSSSQSSISSASSSSTADLDLFLLTDSSFFFKMLKAAALNEKIAETKRLNFSVNNGRVYCNRKRKNSSLQQQLYSQLSSEIHNNTALEGRFLLVKELATAANNNSKIKRYFWRDNDLCLSLTRDVGRYRRCCTSGNNRADELEYVILLETCLAEMFRESEYLPHRATLLTANSNAVLRTVLEGISTRPAVSQYLPNSTEVEGLCTELCDSTTSLLFEILLMAAEHPKHGAELTVSHVVSLLEANSSSFIPVYSAVIERSLTLVSRSASAIQTLLIYQAFYVLDMLGRRSSLLGDVLKSKYSEDIRYYCKTPEAKIVRYSPLQALAIEKVHSLTAFVCSSE